MSSTSDRTRIVLEEAAHWYLRSFDERAMPRADREDFVAWLKHSPENIAQFLRIAEMDGKFVARKLRDTLGDLDGSNVVDINAGSNAADYDYPPRKAVSSKVKPTRNSKTWSKWGMAAAIAMMMVLLGFFLNRDPDGVVETVAAQWQHRTLEDGSTVSLDARTRARIEFTPERRIVHLDHGWAVFEVAKDRSRPFTVSTDSINVTAVGTRFGVAIENGVTTTVDEGIVEVTTRDRKDGSSVRLHPGQELYVEPAGTLNLSAGSIVPVDAKRKLLWVTGRVELNNTTIGEIVRQFNRRQELQAKIEDPQLADLHVDLALMQVDKVESFIELMESRGVAVTRSGSTLTLRAARME